MQSSRAVLSLWVLLALVVGYAAGLVHPGTAAAGPTAMESNSPYLTSSAEGNALYVWRLKDGLPVSASRYSFDTSTNVVDGEVTTQAAIGVLHAQVPPADGKSK